MMRSSIFWYCEYCVPSSFASLLVARAFICGSLSGANIPRYFKEDGGSGAMYILTFA